jgi:hypothetical protein
MMSGNILYENQKFNARDNGGNVWLGNFYSDYSGKDLDGDEVGDQPHIIQGRRGAMSIDPKPFVTPEWLEGGRG